MRIRVCWSGYDAVFYIVFFEARLNYTASKIETMRHDCCAKDTASLIQTGKLA